MSKMKSAPKPARKRGRPLSDAPARGVHRARVDLTTAEYAEVVRIAAQEDRTVAAQLQRWVREGMA